MTRRRREVLKGGLAAGLGAAAMSLIGCGGGKDGNEASTGPRTPAA